MISSAREIKEKETRVRNFLKSSKLDALALVNSSNFAWLTGGADNSVLWSLDMGFAVAVVTPQDKMIVTRNNEAPRIMDEQVYGQDFKLIQIPWTEDLISALKEKVKGKIGIDLPVNGLYQIPLEKMRKLRLPLIPEEVERYRKLCMDTARAITETCKEVEIGFTEYKIASIISQKLIEKNIIPEVVFVGTDFRIYKYRHPVPTEKKLDRYAMLALVAKRCGLHVTMSRELHFGEVPKDLLSKYYDVAKIMHRFQKLSKPGMKFGELAKEIIDYENKLGHKGEWDKHWPGGPTGYEIREFDIVPGIEQEIVAGQAVGWNPTLGGVKLENTLFVGRDSTEVLTRDEEWPLLELDVDEGKIYMEDIFRR
jgi:Xaa-Pro aminopeptidase